MTGKARIPTALSVRRKTADPRPRRSYTAAVINIADSTESRRHSRGNRAGAEWHSRDDKLKIYGEASGQPVDICPFFGKHVLQGHKGNLENFADVLDGKKDPVYRPQQGVDMIKILSAIYESAETGKEILF